MGKYYIVEITGMNKKLLEVVDAASCKDARVYASHQYTSIITSLESKLWIGTKAAYEEHHKAACEQVATYQDKRFLQLQDGVRRELKQAQARGENTLMIGTRLSGICQGLYIANAINDGQMTEIILNMKNEFNF